MWAPRFIFVLFYILLFLQPPMQQVECHFIQSSRRGPHSSLPLLFCAGLSDEGLHCREFGSAYVSFVSKDLNVISWGLPSGAPWASTHTHVRTPPHQAASCHLRPPPPAPTACFHSPFPRWKGQPGLHLIMAGPPPSLLFFSSNSTSAQRESSCR